MSDGFAGWRHPEFRRGARDIAGILPGIGAWALITGVTMVKAGMSVPLALAMTVLVYAGSAQLAALPLMVAGAPIWVVWATAFCVNLRFVVFSAQWRPYFAPYPRARRALLGFFSGDLNYVLFMRRFPEPTPSPEQIPYFWGGALANWATWQTLSVAGIVLADTIPTTWGIGFAGTLALIGLACSLLGDRASLLSAGVAGCAAIAAYALPLRLNILVAIAAAVAAGLLMDRSRPGPPGRAVAVGDSR